MEPLVPWVLSCLLVSLRIAPALAFAPPFSLTRTPPSFRALLGLGVAALLLSARPDALIDDLSPGFLAQAAVRELFVGATFACALQIVFGALQMAGRTIDIQAGFGLSAVIDPTTNASLPLAGTLYAYAFGAVFFALDGHGELLRIVAASLDSIPVGEGAAPASLAGFFAFLSVVMLVAFGVAGAAILCLFVADLGVALLARTAPQMNALLFGFQAKTLVMLFALPITFGVSGALLARLARVTLEALPRLVR